MSATLIEVESSAIRAVGYDGYTLAVVLHTSDTVYEHPDVPYEVCVGLLQAESKGDYYNAQIRGKYR